MRSVVCLLYINLIVRKCTNQGWFNEFTIFIWLFDDRVSEWSERLIQGTYFRIIINIEYIYSFRFIKDNSTEKNYSKCYLFHFYFHFHSSEQCAFFLHVYWDLWKCLNGIKLKIYVQLTLLFQAITFLPLDQSYFHSYSWINLKLSLLYPFDLLKGSKVFSSAKAFSWWPFFLSCPTPWVYYTENWFKLIIAFCINECEIKKEWATESILNEPVNQFSGKFNSIFAPNSISLTYNIK